MENTAFFVKSMAKKMLLKTLDRPESPPMIIVHHSTVLRWFRCK